MCAQDTEENATRRYVLNTVMEYVEAWPDIVALWSGMVHKLVEDGWTEQAARALVLSSVTADNAALLATFPDAIEDDEEDGDDEIQA